MRFDSTVTPSNAKAALDAFTAGQLAASRLSIAHEAECIAEGIDDPHCSCERLGLVLEYESLEEALFSGNLANPNSLFRLMDDGIIKEVR